MNEKSTNPEHTYEPCAERVEINTLEQKIDSTLEKLLNDGINTSQWNDDYLDVPDDVVALEDFH